MRDEFEYIDTQDSLLRMCKRLKFEKEIGVDIECENNFHHYGVYVSIIQISTRDHNFIVDVLLLKDIRPLSQVMEDSHITKIFHNVDFDFRILGSQFGFRPKNVFDTQKAAAFLGKKDLGLAAMLGEYFGINKLTQFQKADWTKRPISRKMLSYAVKDSSYLIQLRHILEEELRKANKLGWVMEEFKVIERTDWKYPKFSYSDVKGYRSLDEMQRSVLKEIFNLRELIARKIDRPVHFVISNKLLLDLAKNPPAKLSFWQNMHGVHPAVRDNAERFFYSVQEGLKRTIVIPKTRKFRYSEKQKLQINRLDTLREELGKKFNLSPHMIMSKDQIHEIVLNQNLDSLKQWQRAVLEKDFNFS